MANAPVITMVEEIRDAARPLDGLAGQFDPLLERVGEAPLVLLGEASHGTREFYAARAAITRRLIEEKGFNAVALEADWPDAYRVNRYVRGRGDDLDADEALRDFVRFPNWMWRNREVVRLVEWLKNHNQKRPDAARAGFYGLDLYSLYSSIDSVIRYLDRMDPEAAARARERYSCFDHADDPSSYGRAVAIGTRPSCENEAVAQLIELRRRAADYLRRDGLMAADEQFFAEPIARLVADAEQYYRAMFGWRVNTWNLRDRHMAETLAALSEHLRRTVGTAKIIVWAHNSHIGDARATEMGDREELNLGQLVRQQSSAEAVLVGFTTHAGEVSAASQWGAPVERKRVRPSLPDSFENVFHQVGHDDFLLVLDQGIAVEHLRRPRLERAIGVVYRPDSERVSHYFNAELSHQFDAVIHFDQTRAVEPLEPTSQWKRGEFPETYPSGL
jgi:erythromycin esterase-like protein